MSDKKSLLFILLLAVVLFIVFFIIPKSHSPTLTRDNLSTSDRIEQDVIRVAKLNRLLLKTSNYQTADIFSQSSITDTDVKERKIAMLELAKESPITFLSLALSQSTRDKMSDDIQKNLETDVNLTGELQTKISTRINKGTKPENSIQYFIKVGADLYNLYSTTPINIPTGSTISVSAVGLGSVLVPKLSKDSIQVVKLKEPDFSETMGNQQTAVFLISFQDSGQLPFSATEAQNFVFGSSTPSQFRAFYKEQSYNKIDFVGDIFGWFNLPENAVDFDPYRDIGNIITQNNINLSRYSRVFFIFNMDSGFNGTFMIAGIGKGHVTLNGNDYYLSITNMFGNDAYLQPYTTDSQPFPLTQIDYMLSWGMAANLGNWPESGWQCYGQTLYGDCRNVWFGNPFQVLGGWTYSLHLNAISKELMGWIGSGNIVTANGNHNTYVISPLETPDGIKTLKIKPLQLSRADSPTYSVEFRKNIGFDSNLSRDDLNSNLNGVFINKRIENYIYYLTSPPWPLPTFPQILDARPSGIDWLEDIKTATLNQGETFSDPGRGISLTVATSTDNLTKLVRVDFSQPICINNPPNDVLLVSSHFIPSNSSGYIEIMYQNGDYYACSPNNFKIKFEPTRPLTIETIDQTSVPLSPETYGYYYGFIQVPESTPPGEYRINYTIQNTANGSARVSSFFTVNVI